MARPRLRDLGIATGQLPPGPLNAITDVAGVRVGVATLIRGGITVISPRGELVEFVPMPDYYATNICFGGKDLRTAYITLSHSGRLVAMPWPRPGLPLNFLNKP